MSTITIETSEHRCGTVNDDAHIQYPTVVTIDGEPTCIMNDDRFDVIQQLTDLIVTATTTTDHDTVLMIARVIDDFVAE